MKNCSRDSKIKPIRVLPLPKYVIYYKQACTFIKSVDLGTVDREDVYCKLTWWCVPTSDLKRYLQHDSWSSGSPLIKHFHECQFDFS